MDNLTLIGGSAIFLGGFFLCCLMISWTSAYLRRQEECIQDARAEISELKNGQSVSVFPNGNAIQGSLNGDWREDPLIGNEYAANAHMMDKDTASLHAQGSF